MEISCVIGGADRLGEGVIWDPKNDILWWVDIKNGVIHKFNPKSCEQTQCDFGEPVGAVAPSLDGRLIVAAQSGFWAFCPESGARSHIVNPEQNMPANRFNDGALDRNGRFWAGTMRSDSKKEAVGSLYRLASDMSIMSWRQNFYTINGLAFSPKGDFMYFSDSGKSVQKIWRAEYNTDTGIPGKVELFFDALTIDGKPDGATVDQDGFYWFAGVYGGKIYRLSPSGKVDFVLKVPVNMPSKVAFGGRNLDILYFTSIYSDRHLESSSDKKNAGGLFAVHGLGVSGVPESLFSLE